MTSQRALVAAVALLILGAPAAAGAQAPPATELGTSPRATGVAAGSGWTAWSTYDGGRYRLVTVAPDGTVSRPPVASRGVPFDLDIGSDDTGRPVAAFSRCGHEPTLVGGSNATAPNPTSGRGCRISVLDLATGRERRLARSLGSSSDVLPSVAGDRIAFVAVPTARALAGKAVLAVRTRSSRSARRLDVGPRRSGGPGVAGGPASVDFDGTRVAAVWRALDPEFHSFDSLLRVTTLKGRPRQVAYGSNTEECSYDQVLAPTLTGATVTFLETDGMGWLAERTPLTGDHRSFGPSRPASDDPVVVTSAAVDGARLVVAETTAAAGVGHAAGATVIRQLPLGTFASGNRPISFCS